MTEPATALVDLLSAGPSRTLAAARREKVAEPLPMPQAFRARDARDELLLLLLAHGVVERTTGGTVTPNHAVGIPAELHYAQMAAPSAPRGRPARSVESAAALDAELEELRTELAQADRAVAAAMEQRAQISRTLLQRSAQREALNRPGRLAF